MNRIRIKQHFVISISVGYIGKILNCRKRYEFRKYKFAKKGDIIIIYAKQPIGRIVAIFNVVKVITAPPAELWKKINKDYAGMTEAQFKKKFFTYLKDLNALKIGKLRRFKQCLDLKEAVDLNTDQLQKYKLISKDKYDRLISEYEFEETHRQV
jgi:predicted transcriptional regulator